MSDLDDRLQAQLDQLESGAELESVLSDLPNEAGELRPLIGLAAAIGGLPPVIPSPKQARRQQERFTAAARRYASAQPRRAVDWRPWRGLVLAGLALLVLCTLGALPLGWWLANLPLARTATLSEAGGQVEVASAPDAADWRLVAPGEKLHGGQRLRTQAGASATLVFFDGSRTILGPETDLTLSRLTASWRSGRQIELWQSAGQTEHYVTPQPGQDGQFIVATPAGTASVQGTAFSVTIDGRGRALFSVASGQVSVANAGAEVKLTAGQATLAQPNTAPQAPAYQFIVNDQLTAINGEFWVVADVLIRATDQTIILDSPRIGDFVLVQGRIQAENQWVADRIEPSSGGTARFAGTVEAIGSEAWLINGTTVLVNEVTAVADGLAVGAHVRVTYTLLADHRWLALSIEPLDPPAQPAPPSRQAPTMTWTPEPTGVNCTGATPQPKSQELAVKYNVPAAEIMEWFCQGFGFGEIELAYSLSLETGVPVAEIFALRQAGQAWGEITKQLTGGDKFPTKKP
jgi:hypothetical protein